VKLIDYIVVIPARFDSKRLPGKALLDISGKTLIEHVFLAASKSQASEIIIATDSEKIKKTAKNLNAKTVMTRTNHRSGTDRVAEVAEIENWKEDQIIVNVQGDCPLMPPENIDQVASLLFNNRDAGIATLATKIVDPEEINDPNVVKVNFDAAGKAISFRRKIRHSVDQKICLWRHIGIYAYTLATLKKFSQHPRTKSEIEARLEQLRAFDLKMKIIIEEAVIFPGPDVDTEQDLYTVRRILGAN
jgi:3-deoxy-manno-octulosonate cytidylyltransferase (CMP-KDO synthetase)